MQEVLYVPLLSDKMCKKKTPQQSCATALTLKDIREAFYPYLSLNKLSTYSILSIYKKLIGR